jgi:hypothetical protein
MNTRDLTDDIIERLHDAACSGEVAEVFVVYLDAGGTFYSATSTDDLHALIDAARARLAELENGTRRRGTLN